MTPIRSWTSAVLIAFYACGTSAAVATDKHKEEAAKHAAEKAEHERKKHEEEARKAEHERLKHEAAEREKMHKQQEKAEHDKKKHEEEAKNAEHHKKAKEDSEARIAAMKKHRADHPVQKSKQTARDREIAGNLSKVAVELHKADHDYDWQRHEAVEQLRGALHELHEPEPNTHGKFGDMTQAKSDAILKENLPALESIKTQLAAKGAPAHHQAAMRKVEEAISNIQAALKIR